MTSVRRTAVHASSSFAWHVGAVATAIAVSIAGACPLPCGGQTWNTNGNNIHNTNTGNVGIGTTNPSILAADERR
jgi:hypothetical protein